MDILLTIIDILLTTLGIVWSLLWWFLSFLLMPFLILAVIIGVGLRVAYRYPLTKPYVERLFKRMGERGLGWLKNLLFMITVQPFRILFRFTWFSILYAWVNLWWRPRWTPWSRAIGKPPEKRGLFGRRIKDKATKKAESKAKKEEKKQAKKDKKLAIEEKKATGKEKEEESVEQT